MPAGRTIAESSRLRGAEFNWSLSSDEFLVGSTADSEGADQASQPFLKSPKQPRYG